MNFKLIRIIALIIIACQLSFSCSWTADPGGYGQNSSSDSSVNSGNSGSSSSSSVTSSTGNPASSASGSVSSGPAVPVNGTNNFNYEITYAGPTNDGYYPICSMNCQVITSTTNIYYPISSLATDGDIYMSWYSASTEMPYMLFYTLDPSGVISNKKYISLIPVQTNNQILNIYLTNINDTAVYTNNLTTICVTWSYWINDYNPYFTFYGYAIDNSTVISTDTISIMTGSATFMSYGHYNMWLNLKGSKIYLDGGNASE